MAFKFIPTRQQLGVISGAFLLAFLLWLFVTSQNTYSLEMEVPIEVRNIQAMKTLREEIPREARVRFSGTGRALLKTFLLKSMLDLKLVVDLERIQTDYDFVLNEYFQRYPQKISIPSSLAINFVEVVYPDSLHISLDDIMVKRVPVRAEIRAEAAPGYLIIGNPVISPAMVELSGPKDLIRGIDHVAVPRDTLLNLDLPVRKTYRLEAMDRLVNLSQTDILYRLEVQAVGERIIAEIPVQVTNVLPNLRVFVNPRTVALTITGGVDQIAAVQPEDIRVTIDFGRQWNPRQQFYEPTVSVPPGLLSWSDLSPRNLELVVTRESG